MSYWDDDPEWFGELEQDETERDASATGANEEADDVALGAQHCLLLIDLGCPEVWDDTLLPHPDYPDDRLSPMDLLLLSVEKLVRTKIRQTITLHTGKRDALGVFLYHTRFRTPIATNDDTTETDAKVSAAKTADVDMDDDDDDDQNELDSTWIDETKQPCTTHEFLPLQPPGVETVRKLRSVQDDLTLGRTFDLQAEYAPTDDPMPVEEQNPFKMALHKVSGIWQDSKFVRQKVKAGEPQDRKQIWIFTTQEDPSEGDEQTFRTLQTAIQDARDQGVEFVVWPLPTASKEPFDYSKFYNRIQAVTPLQEQAESGEDLSNQLLLSLQDEWKRVRRALTVPLLLPDWKEHPERPGMAMDLYRLVQVARLPPKVKIHQQTGRMLSSVRQVVPKGSSRIIEEYRTDATSSSGAKLVRKSKDQIRTFCIFGGEHVYISLDDKVALKKAANANPEFASLILLGFRDKDSIPAVHCLEQSYFAYPSDERTVGSTTMFAHLHASMLQKGVLGIGELLPRATATSRLVALWPLPEETEQVDQGNHILSILKRPPGMMITTIPFEDEVRSMGTDAAVQALEEEQGTDLASEQVVQAAMDLVEKQTIENVEIGENFENARMDKFWDYVEHVALAQQLTSGREYDTILDKDEISKLVGAEAAAFEAALPADIEKTPKKRKIVPDESGGLDWETIFREGRLDDCRNVDLQKKLASLGEKKQGKKSELIERLLPHLAEEYGTAKVKEAVVKEEGATVKEEGVL